ncbi:hypothetical protein NSS75_18615 [Bacillus sp. FSL K6-1012]|nr:hypothetical protein [Bacillus halotolerans]MEC3639000.1 hypothetical protein [Bacillus halotolerans]QPZ42623.1 hypothetical protein I7X10_01875 [Bacillus halotolerans]
MFQREIFIKQKKTKAPKCQALVFPVVLLDALGGIRPPADVVPETIQMLL